MNIFTSCTVAPSQHGGIIYAVGGSAEVGGSGHADLESLEPGLPAECDCSLCGPCDHLVWQLGPARLPAPRTFSAVAAAETGGEAVLLVVGGDPDPDLTTSSAMLYSRRTERWAAAPHTAARRDSCRLVTLNGFIYAVGGYDNTCNQALATCEK